jgi:hypothetical protein
MTVRLQRIIRRKGEETSVPEVPEVRSDFERNGMGNLEISAS